VPATGNETAGTITVVPPVGASGQVVPVAVYNPDSQNSMLLGEDIPAYTYPVGPDPQITGVSPSSLPAAASAYIDINAVNSNFVDGQVSVGFGTSDVSVERVWVLSPTRLLVNVMVAQGAPLAVNSMSVISGLQVMPQAAQLQTLTARPGMPFLSLPIVNAASAQQPVYSGSIATVYGQSLTTGNVQLTLNDRVVPIQFSSLNQINFVVPPDFPPGLATLRLNNGLVSAFPVLVQIDEAPPAILSVTTQSGVTLGGAAVTAADVLNVLVTGLDAGTVTNPGRVRVTVGGVDVTPSQITLASNGIYLVQFTMPAGIAAGSTAVQVTLNGRASAIFTILVK
jgi:uncharacterized protein (TIGR03437 family)